MWVLFRGKTVKNEKNEIARFAGSITDIEDRKHKEAEIENLAYYDQLTSLPNRIQAIEMTKRAIRSCEKEKHCGLMFIDIDNFKYINDTFGHPVGDKVLMQCAQVLSSLVNENIHLARFGGDEFMLLVEDTTIDQMEKIRQARGPAPRAENDDRRAVPLPHVERRNRALSRPRGNDRGTAPESRRGAAPREICRQDAIFHVRRFDSAGSRRAHGSRERVAYGNRKQGTVGRLPAADQRQHGQDRGL